MRTNMEDKPVRANAATTNKKRCAEYTPVDQMSPSRKRRKCRKKSLRGGLPIVSLLQLSDCKLATKLVELCVFVEAAVSGTDPPYRRP